MKADLFDSNGKKLKSVELPAQFNEEYEFDLIQRAVLVIFSRLRQAYGTQPRAGQHQSAKLSRRRRNYKGAYGKSLSRMPRKTTWRRGMQFGWTGAVSPGTVGGRKAHPPKASKIWELQINDKERKKAIRSALNGVVSKSKLIVIENKFETLKQTKDVKQTLKSLNLDVEGVKRNKAGRGKSGGRSVRYKKNPLVVVGGKCALMKAVNNLPGYDVVDVKSINAAVLTLGHKVPRSCIFTENALELMDKERLFMNKK